MIHIRPPVRVAGGERRGSERGVRSPRAAVAGTSRARSPCRRWAAAAALLGVALCWPAAAAAAAAAEVEDGALLVTGVAFSEGAGGGGAELEGAALGALLAGALAARGLAARSVPPPAECRAPHAPDAPGCLRAVLQALARGALHACVLPSAADALPAAPRLREAGLEAWGPLEAGGGGARRGCWARGALRSLAELAEAAAARAYALGPATVARLTSAPRYFCEPSEPEPRPTPCPGELATAVVGPDAEARELLRVARAAGLRLQALALGARWRPAAAAALGALTCGRALRPGGGARALGPPPCLDELACAFDARPLLKLGNVRALAGLPGAARALDRLALPPGGVARLAADARARGAGPAARAALAAADAGRGPAEVRVAVMVPATTRREVAEPASALRAAAELAELDLAREGRAARVRHKVELLDSGCAAPRAFKYLTDALGAEFHALSAVAGPACAAPFAAVARQSATLALPLLAYTAQRPAPGALLAAGSASAATPALAALLATLGWRRVALLTEAGGAAADEAALLGAEVLAHLELPEAEDPPEDLLDQWAAAAAARGARVVLLRVEDARAARGALCALARAGLTPRAGAALLLAAALPERWLLGAAPAGCDVRAQADAMLRLQPEWAARWQAGGGGAGNASRAWAARWRERVRPAPADDAWPPAGAALLYDALRLWAAALDRLLAARPEALDDLHRADRVASLMQDAVSSPYSGLTGAFEWEGAARGGALLVQQWRAGAGAWAEAGRWRRGALRLRVGALQWRAPGGRAPDDGAEGCARRPLARDCRARVGAVLALLLAALACALGGGAWHCRRRAAREHRARLAAFGMRALGPRAGAPDRWELPRERVVINRRLGAGAFGAVYGGHALLGGGRGWAAVAVKTLRADASTEEKLDFLSEAEAMKRFSHARVVRLLGVVTRSAPVCTVMEYMLHGDLKGYLVARRHLAGLAREAAPARLTRMACDAARGLAYLARLRYVHRDVAARNCLVDATLRVKLADFGMTRVVFESEYYRFGRRGMLPVRWMAPESLALGVFSPASDVWSFGVLLYEIATFGALPHRGLCNAEVLERAKAGGAPALPAALEPQLEALIRSCWRVSRRARPTAAALVEQLTQRPRLLAPCLAPPDALDEPLAARAEPGAALEMQSHWEACPWGAPTSAETDITYLSAPPDVTCLSAPPDVTFLGAPPDVTSLTRSAPLDTDPFLPAPATPSATR